MSETTIDLRDGVTSEPNYINANGLQFAYLSWGEGPLVVCMHGFPDSAYTWDRIGPALAADGYRVIAPFMRGYEPTEIPDSDQNTSEDLGKDVLAIIDALSENSAIIIGHDWGASAVYTACALDASKVDKLITLAIPHPRSLRPSPKLIWRARHFITFQFRRSAQRFLQRDGSSGVDAIYARWSPTWDVPLDELAYIKRSYANDEYCRASLAYYWSLRVSDRADNQRIQRLVSKKTSVDTLCIVGADDGALVLDNLEKTRGCFTGSYQYEVIPDAGHFPHREKHEEVLRLIQEFLAN